MRPIPPRIPQYNLNRPMTKRPQQPRFGNTAKIISPPMPDPNVVPAELTELVRNFAGKNYYEISQSCTDFQRLAERITHLQTRFAILDALRKTINCTEIETVKINDLTQAIAVVPEDSLRALYIDVMLDNSYAQTRQAGAQAILAVTDPDQRNRLIEKACQNSTPAVRGIAVLQLPYHTDDDKRQYLLSLGMTDEDSSVRERGDMVAGKRPLKNKYMKHIVMPGALAPTPMNVMLPMLQVPGAKAPPTPQSDPENGRLANALSKALKEQAAEPNLFQSHAASQTGPKTPLEIAGHFYQKAQQYLQERMPNSGLRRLWPARPKADDVARLSRFLMEAALATGNFLLKGVDLKPIDGLPQLCKESQQIKTDLLELDDALATHYQIRVHTEKTVKKQEEQVKTLEQKWGEASKSQDALALGKANQDLVIAKNALASSQANLQRETGAYQQIEANYTKLHQGLLTIQNQMYNMIAASAVRHTQELLKRLQQKSDELEQNKIFQAAMESAQVRHFECLAESEEDLAAKRKEGELTLMRTQATSPS